MANHKTRQTLRIIEATMLQIQDYGLSSLNIAKIAEAAGMTRQTIYNYFPNVESIVAKMLKLHSEAMEQQLLTALEAEASAKAKLRAFVDFQISMASTEHKSIPLEAGLSAESRKLLSESTDKTRLLLKKVISSGIETADFRPTLSADIVTDLIWGLVNGSINVLAEHQNQKPAIREALLRAILSFL